MPLKLVPPRKGRTDFWYIRGTVAGRSINASTKARDEAGALRFKEEFESRLKQAEADKHAPLTFGQAAKLYIAYRDPSRQDRRYIENLVAVLGNTMMVDLKQHMLINAANSLYPQGEASTKNRSALVPAGAIIHYAAENNLCGYMRVRKFKEKSPEPRPVAKDIARALIASSDGDLRTAIVFLFCQGWRVSDMLRMVWQNVDLNEGTVRYRIGKTDKWRIKPLHADVLLLLSVAPKTIGPVFPWKDRSALYRDLKPLCKKLGVHFTPHMARHSFATWRLNDGASPQEVMDGGGWESINSVLRYGKLNQKSIRAAVDRIKL